MRVKHLFVQIIIPTGCVAPAKEHTYQYRDSPVNTNPRFGPGIEKNLSINQVFFYLSLKGKSFTIHTYAKLKLTLLARSITTIYCH